MNSNSNVQPVWIGGRWRAATGSDVFYGTNPSTGEKLPSQFPISSWADCDEALTAATNAAAEMRGLSRERISQFLNEFASAIEGAKESLVETAFAETALAKSPRLGDVELPRTTNQLRTAAAACTEGSWALPTIDTKANIRSCYEPLGPVCVFGPNNFPFAFNSVAGGDFAAAIAAGNPVIAKANTSHPATTYQLAKLASQVIDALKLPAAMVQLIYRTSHTDGERLVSDLRVGATGYTGSRSAGLKLKAAADAAGKPIYLELSSINPVIITPNALLERGDKIADEFLTSALMGTGQFCTNPGMVILIDAPESQKLVEAIANRYRGTAPGTLLSPAVAKSLASSVNTLCGYGAELLAGGGEPEQGRCAYANTLLKITGRQFLANPYGFQTEAFGNASLVVIAANLDELVNVINRLEGNLTGCVYSATGASDESTYARIVTALTPKVGRVLNDKMPTGVAVSPAMNHGGPFPATGHPGFTAVGIPASLLRFGKLTCYDNVRASRLPKLVADENPTGKTWRLIDGQWTTSCWKASGS